MAKTKQFDAEGMAEFFDIENELVGFDDADIVIEDEEVFDIVTTDQDDIDVELDLVGETSVEKQIMEEMLTMLKEIKEVIGVAKFLLDSSPDTETISSAAKLFTSASQLMKELNKGILDSKKQRFTERLEKIKIKARAELVERKAELEANKLPNVAEGGTLNITQNNMVAFSPEEVVRNMVVAQKDLKK